MKCRFKFPARPQSIISKCCDTSTTNEEEEGGEHVARRSRRAAAGVKGQHQGGGGKVTRIFFRLINPSAVHPEQRPDHWNGWSWAGWQPIPLPKGEWAAQSPLCLAGLFRGCTAPGTAGCCCCFLQGVPLWQHEPLLF